jgi:AraC-like DNA-binding protein
VLRYREIRPQIRLRTIIDSFWILEQDGVDGAPQRVVPDGHPELILNWGQPFEARAAGHGQWQGQPRCFLAGQIEGPLLLRPNGPAKMLGIRFHPHGAAAVLSAPMHELSGRFTPVEELSPALSRNLIRALESPEPIAQVIARVEAAMLSAQNDTHGCDLMLAEAVRRIALEHGASDLGSLARELGVSPRQLERRFQAVVGLTPKLFSRMQRLNSVFRAIGEQPGNWVDTAIACGYYDQAHLIRDCKNLTGNTPAILLAQDADLARHFLLRFGVSHSYKTHRRDTV